jgi:hypothetical protein
MPNKSYIGSNHVVLTPNTAAGNTRGDQVYYKTNVEPGCNVVEYIDRNGAEMTNYRSSD